MSAEISTLLLALGIQLVGLISIGPNILAILGTSMNKGRNAGIQLALGVVTGTFVWATLSVVGLTALITAYAGIVTLLKIFGAVYLSWLAYRAFRSAAIKTKMQEPVSAEGKKLFFQGLAIQLTNPKAALQWIAMVSIGLGAEAPIWVGLTLIIIGTFISFVTHMFYAFSFSTDLVVDFYRKSRRWIEASLGLFFSFAAYKIATFRY